jgi:hypothetical protein
MIFLLRITEEVGDGYRKGIQNGERRTENLKLGFDLAYLRRVRSA